MLNNSKNVKIATSKIGRLKLVNKLFYLKIVLKIFKTTKSNVELQAKVEPSYS